MTDGAQATCQPSSANFSSASASYSHVAEVRSQVQCSVATAVEPVCLTPAVSTWSCAASISCVIRSYDAWAVVAVSLVSATFDRSLAVNPDASAVAASWGSGSSDESSPPESPVHPAAPTTRAMARVRAAAEVASCRQLYRPPPSRGRRARL